MALFFDEGEHRGMHGSRSDDTNDLLCVPRALHESTPYGRYTEHMTVKERLHRMVDEMTEAEAEATLRRIDVQRTDPLVAFFDAAPLDDEPVGAEENAAVAEVDADRGVPRIPFDEIKSKYA